ncbi:hypothetical protein DFH08DRAFT_929747 [Mycena albidolilacea]|uniref:Uncharacterized protein n=1 Tax=Mycena albidolilacea TaxID=1033008 RepID=A0AAD7ASB9_9AGAR|nr:hypothetical protein DFH08DRAFT_929747 [Mycena albidolilacea]
MHIFQNIWVHGNSGGTEGPLRRPRGVSEAPQRRWRLWRRRRRWWAEAWQKHDTAWRFVSQYPHWNPRIEELARAYLRRALGVAPGAPLPPYIAIHVWRGDFAGWCPTTRPVDECFAPLSAYARRVEEVREELQRARGIKEVAAYGWHRVDHSTTVKTHSRWHPVLINAAIQSGDMGFVEGSQGGRRQGGGRRPQAGGGEQRATWWKLRRRGVVPRRMSWAPGSASRCGVECRESSRQALGSLWLGGGICTRRKRERPQRRVEAKEKSRGRQCPSSATDGSIAPSNVPYLVKRHRHRPEAHLLVSSRQARSNSKASPLESKGAYILRNPLDAQRIPKISGIIEFRRVWTDPTEIVGEINGGLLTIQERVASDPSQHLSTPDQEIPEPIRLHGDEVEDSARKGLTERASHVEERGIGTGEGVGTEL